MANRWHTKRVRPMPIGAKGVVTCFSAASISTARHRAAVMKASMKTPWAGLTPGARNVLTVEHEYSTPVPC